MRPLPICIILALMCTGVEAVLWAGEAGWLGTQAQSWRNVCIWLGALWPGILRNEMLPIFPGQSATMLVTYPFLHTGPGHLAGNMVVLIWVGLLLERELGRWAVLILWMTTAAWGAVPLLLSQETAPIVGASGALFGLLGAQIGLLLRTPERRRDVPRIVAVVAGAGILLPLVLPDLTGPMAWLIHGGGLLAGVTYGYAAGK